MSFASLKGHAPPLRVTSLSDSGQRIDGRWVANSDVGRANRNLLASLKLLSSSLPGWSLVDGLDLNAFRPDPHQLLAADMLATPWLGFLGEGEPLARTRLIVADEGGTGKTLTASIAARWVSVKRPEAGPVVVLCPPLLAEEWLKHLRAVFIDDPDRVQHLSSARHFDPRLHRRSIIVVSKFSWAYRWSEIRKRVWSCPPSCVIIDEVHQGRTRFSTELESEFAEEDGSGLIAEEHVPIDTREHGTLARSQRQTCRWAGHVIGVSATPINLDDSELDNILRLMGAEQAGRSFSYEDADEHLPSNRGGAHQSWMKALGELARAARAAGSGDSVDGAPLKAMLPLVDSLRSDGFLRALDSSKMNALKSWLEENSKVGLPAPLALRLCRELHPYGRHLAMTLRKDLPKQDEALDKAKFRTRRERLVEIELGEVEPRYEEFLDKVEKDGVAVGNTEGLTLGSTLIHSHRWNPETTFEGRKRYKGEWTVDGTPFAAWNSLDIEDPRISSLADAIREDIDGPDGTSRGCVIFTEFKGTVQSIRKQDGPRLQELVGREDCEIKFHQLTSEVHLQDARRLLRDCEDQSLHSGQYPVLICTPAGEVGLNMAWATTLVHWDLNPNPQRLEQRTWRLDRRLHPTRDAHFRREYLVLIPVLSSRPVIEKLRETVESRWSQSCDSLGLDPRRYIPDSDRSMEPGASNHQAELFDEEISDARRFIESDDIRLHSGQAMWMHEAECARAALLFSMMSTKSPLDDIVSGRPFSLGFDTGELMTLGSPEAAAVRDLESVSTEVARRCWPGLGEDPVGGGMPELIIAWAAGGDARHLPVLRSAMSMLFAGAPFDAPAKVPLVRMEAGPVPPGRHLLCTHIGLARASDRSSRGGTGTVLSDRGLRVLGEWGELSGSPLEDNKEWAEATRLFCAAVLRGEFKMTEEDAPSLTTPTDVIETRIEELRSRCRGHEEHIERWRAKKEAEAEENEDWLDLEEGEDEYEELLRARIGDLEEEIAFLDELPDGAAVVGVIECGEPLLEVDE